MLDNNYCLVHEQGYTAGNTTLNSSRTASNQLFLNFACCVENLSIFADLLNHNLTVKWREWSQSRAQILKIWKMKATTTHLTDCNH